ncbi:hypothetical protein G7072_07185 [Nocardioides sp. HDW12B]|uniref:hypothetical protein n=1 Tax=Nocardioides sp. HDW12B TaxID=2714939 RepID=UPI00140A5058|nr:hypothetical protein [Nocardioides sp. HDW12B]QIK66154.1 hypothetical protein G7072_07185 [Nocardioides sp. HDW12B]
MQLSEHEMTAALEGAAKTVLAAQRRDVRKGRTDIETVWKEMDRYQRFKLLDSLGDQILPVLMALPDREVPVGERPRYDDAEITAVVEEKLPEGAGKLRRKVVVATRVALVRTALGHVPPRADPERLDVPDHL